MPPERAAKAAKPVKAKKPAADSGISLDRLRADFPMFAARCLKIKDKAGQLCPLNLNRAQRFLHDRLNEQMERTGRVRALVLKGRQAGFSTYIGGRFYARSSLNRGLQTFILTHEQEATNNLFGMVERYHQNNPLHPSTGAANAKELYFDKLDSGYSVGTAGTKAVGRSKTLQLFHGSEVAFWPNAASHFAGVVQAVPDLPGTEIILEFTANGVGGEFHSRWQDAEAGIGDYQAIFVPWFWTPEYRREVPDDFTLDDLEADYREAHDLDMEQMAWRRAKLAELKDPMLFMQEYPATAAEAFQMTGHDSYIRPADILKARKANVDGTGPLVIGVDPARFGTDRFSIAWRKGRQVTKIESRAKLDTVAGANWIKGIIDQDKPAKVFIDVGGTGAGVIDVLRSWGGDYELKVESVNFGSEPQEPERPEGGGPRNRRAEMWMRSNDWLKDVAGVSIPDTDSIQADACAPSYRYDMNQRLLLESKDDMRRRGVRSPDEWDAVALTFAAPVLERSNSARWIQPDNHLRWVV